MNGDILKSNEKRKKEREREINMDVTFTGY